MSGPRVFRCSGRRMEVNQMSSEARVKRNRKSLSPVASVTER